MTERRTITVTAYRTPGGKPTCAANCIDGRMCRFLGTRQFGIVEVCAATGGDIQRESTGYTIPVDGCPVWAEAQS